MVLPPVVVCGLHVCASGQQDAAVICQMSLLLMLDAGCCGALNIPAPVSAGSAAHARVAGGTHIRLSCVRLGPFRRVVIKAYRSFWFRLRHVVTLSDVGKLYCCAPHMVSTYCTQPAAACGMVS